MRVLHIAQPTTPTPPWFAFSRQTHHCAGEGSLLAIRSLIRESAAVAPDDAHIVALLGASHQHARSAALEVRGAARISSPLGQPHRSSGARRLVATAGPLDAVVCWGANLRRLARRAAHASHLWLEVDMHSGDLHALDPHRGSAGTGIGSAVPSLPSLSANAAALRAVARNQLGISESEPVIALVTDAACPASATDLLGALAMLHVAGIRATCVMPTATNELSRAQRRVREGTYVQRVVYSEHGSATAMHAADVAVCAPGPADALGGHASLAWLACEAARVGTPIVAPDAWIGAWSHGTTSPHPLLVSAKAGTPTDLARAIVPLMTGPRPTSNSAAVSTSPSLLTMLRSAVGTHAPHVR